MNIRIWRKESLGYVIYLVIFPVIIIFRDGSDHIESNLLLLLVTILISFVYFIVNYFTYYLKVSEGIIQLRESPFNSVRTYKVEDILKVEPNILNHQYIGINIQLKSGEDISFYLRYKAIDVYKTISEIVN